MNMVTLWDLTGAKRTCLESMQIDPLPVEPGDEADVESEGGTIHPKSKIHTPKDAIATPEPEKAIGKSDGAEPVEIRNDDEDDDAEDEGDEETYAVEKVLSHRIGKKANVCASLVSFCYVYSDISKGRQGLPISYKVAWI